MRRLIQTSEGNHSQLSAGECRHRDLRGTAGRRSCDNSGADVTEIADFNQDVLDAVVPAVQDQGRINLQVNDYIEAQVYGGIDLANDVAEIRFFEKDTSTMTSQQKQEYLDSVQGLRQVASELRVPVVQHQPAEAKLTHL